MGIRCEVYLRVAASEEQLSLNHAPKCTVPAAFLFVAGGLQARVDYHVVNVRGRWKLCRFAR